MMIYGDFACISPHLFKDILSILIAVVRGGPLLFFAINEKQKKNTDFCLVLLYLPTLLLIKIDYYLASSSGFSKSDFS